MITMDQSLQEHKYGLTADDITVIKRNLETKGIVEVRSVDLKPVGFRFQVGLMA